MEATFSYTVPTELVEKQIAAVEKTNRRAERLGIEARYTWTLEEVDPYTYHNEATGESYLVPLTAVHIYGDLVSYGGWTFAATVDWSLGEPLLRRSPALAEEVKLPYPSEKLCDHCGTIRNRKDTYLVLNESGEFKQVGSDCLQAYTGIHPSWVKGSEVGKAWDGAFERLTPYYDPYTVVAYTTAYLRTNGYHKSTEPGLSTKECILAAIHEGGTLGHEVRAEIKRNFDETVEAETKTALEWARGQEASDNDYLHTLAVLAGSKYVTGRHIGYLASLPVAYKRATERTLEKKRAEERKAEAGPVPTGRVEVEGVVISTKVYDNEYSRYGGAVYKFLVELDNGSRVFSTIPSDIAEAIGEDGQWLWVPYTKLHGHRVKFRATITANPDDATFGRAKRPSNGKVIE